MNLKVLKTLEYDKIIARLSELATCEAGKLRCQQLLPINDIEEIKIMQQETECAFNRLVKVGDISASGTTDLRPSLARLELGSSLTIGRSYILFQWPIARGCYFKRDKTMHYRRRDHRR